MNHIEHLESRQHLTAVTSLMLVNADTNTTISAMPATLDLSKLPRNLSIRADADGTTSSVQFVLGSYVHNENDAPYSLTGATGDDYQPFPFALGQQTINVTPWSADNRTGTKGATYAFTFNVITGIVTPPPPPPTTPPPTSTTFKLVDGQSLGSITPKAGDSVLFDGKFRRITIPSSWNGVHCYFNDTLGEGQTGTVLSGGTNIRYHNLRVRGVRNGLQSANAAAKFGTGAIVSDSVFEDNTGTGASFQGQNIRAERTIFQRNGQQGFVIIFCDGLTMAECKILNNNPGLTVRPPWAGQIIEGYTASYFIGGKWYVNPDFEAGGNKIWSSNNVRIENCEAAYNVGPGLWTDYKNTNVTMIGNWCHDNRGLDSARSYQGEGIRLELSPNAGGFTITGNRLERNSGAGITLTSVRDVRITGNTFRDNGVAGVLFRNDDGRGALTNIAVTGNTFYGRAFETWGSRFPMVNVVTSPNTYL